MPEGDRGTLPAGLTVEQVLNQMLQAGLVQKTDDGRLTCPIPSLASHMAASAEEMGQVMERCRQDAECGALLQATDPRGRTPLILAIELGLIPLVELLVTAESQLPAALRTVAHRDHRGRTAHDHVATSEDSRLMALLDRLQLPGVASG